MTTHPSATSVASTRSTETNYLSDLFQHARSRSRRISAAQHTLRLTVASDPEGEEAIRLENAVSDFTATIALAAVEQLKRVAVIAPGYDGYDALPALKPWQVDEFVQPVFETSGIAEDFIPWREAFPRYDDPAIPDE